MNKHKPTSNPIKIGTAIIPISIQNVVSKLFASGIAISCFFAGGGGGSAVLFGIVDTKNGTNHKTDNTAHNKSNKKIQH